MIFPKSVLRRRQAWSHQVPIFPPFLTKCSNGSFIPAINFELYPMLKPTRLVRFTQTNHIPPDWGSYASPLYDHLLVLTIQRRPSSARQREGSLRSLTVVSASDISKQVLPSSPFLQTRPFHCRPQSAMPARRTVGRLS